MNIRRLIESIRRWLRGGDEAYTVAADLSPFAYPGNDRERLFHVVGIKTARRTARRWVRAHQCGQARILRGHLTFSDAGQDAANR